MQIRASVVLIIGVMCLSLACPKAPSGCGNETELWLNRVLQEPECRGCVELHFPARLLDADTLRIGDEPDYVLGRCEVAEVLRFDDGIGLILSAPADESLALFREAMGENLRDALVAIRLPDAQFPIAVIGAEEEVLLLFDFASKKEIDQFLKDLNPSETAVVRRRQRLMADFVGNPVGEEAEQLLRDIAEESRVWAELQAAYERDADAATIQSLSDQLNLPESDE